MVKWWMVRAGDNNELIAVSEKNSIASIGWSQLGNPRFYKTKDELMLKADEYFEESKPNSRKSWVNQLWRFSREVKKNDRVISYIKETREYIVGTVIEEHFFDTSIGNENYPNHIRVEWLPQRISRDNLSQAAKNSLGSTLTVFRIDNWGEEFEKLLADPDSKPDNIEENSEEEVIEDLLNKGLVMVQDKIDQLDPWKMQDLVGGLLRAMKYNVQISPKGPDGGVDILASKDAFGFEKPIIKVQVKHRKNSASAPEVRQLLGANPIGANCLFVSTGGFTSTAKHEAQRNSVELIDLEQLVLLIIRWYSNIPNDIKAFIPLQKMYLPE